MSSSQQEISESGIVTSDIEFDTYEIDYKIFKDGEFIQKATPESSQLNKFRLIKNLTQEEIQKNDSNLEYPKYFSMVSSKDFNYIGILSNQLKRDKYGYSQMDNGDEYLGEYKNEIREGFGIYKFNYDKKVEKEEERIQEIYIGNYKNNKKEGKGMYLKIYKSEKDNINNEINLINFDSGIGSFEGDIFKYGKIFYSKNGIDMIYKGKLNDNGEPEDDDALIFEEGNKIFRGKISNGDMVEGRNIFINEKYEKIKAYYFYKKGSEFSFDYANKEEVDEECIKMMKENPVNNHGKIIKNIFKEIIIAFNKFKDYDTAVKIDFENEIKNKILSEIDKILK